MCPNLLECSFTGRSGVKTRIRIPQRSLLPASFRGGAESVNPCFIRQGAIYDCKFLATLASIVRNDSGRMVVYKAVKTTSDGYLVRFPSLQNYAIVGYDAVRRRLLLYDPYGSGDLRKQGAKVVIDGSDDGLFSIGLEDFNYLFSHIKIGL